jgi:hypothetical protein
LTLRKLFLQGAVIERIFLFLHGVTSGYRSGSIVKTCILFFKSNFYAEDPVFVHADAGDGPGSTYRAIDL